jgi:anaerobic dimethyl sulfoxide reductase subunit B (iron-sulfur subunit)
MSRRALLIDYEFCTGCQACEVICKMEHGRPEGQWGIKVVEIGPWKMSGEKWQLEYMPVPTSQCNLCHRRVRNGKKPACVHSCQSQVMKFGTVEELTKEMENKAKQVLFVPR